MWNIEIAHHGTRIGAMPDKASDGRNLRDGYIRGCGIQFGNIRQLCAQDPLFVRAHSAARPLTLLTEENLINLFMIVRFHLASLPPGHIVEFGSYKGGSAIFMAIIAQDILPGTKVVAFDTFEGMPEVDSVRDTVSKGDFKDTDLGKLRATANLLGLSNLEFVQGRFEDTAERALSALGRVRLAHIDCDIYDGIVAAYEPVKKVMVPGGYIIFDDPLISACLGAFEAVERLLIRRDGLHAEQVSPHMVFRYPPLSP